MHKKIYRLTFFFILFPLAFHAFAQSDPELKVTKDLTIKGDLTVNNNVFYVDSGANEVGIGNTAPDALLDVDGNVSITNNLSVGDNLYVDGDGGGGLITFGNGETIDNQTDGTIILTANNVQMSNNASVENNLSVAETLFANGMLIINQFNHVLAVGGGNNDDINIGNGTFINVTGMDGTDFAIRGIAGGVPGRLIFLYNASTTNDEEMQLEHEDAGSAAANRLILKKGNTVKVKDRQGTTLVYDGDQNRWVHVGKA